MTGVQTCALPIYWIIESPRQISRHSVISANHFQGKTGTTIPHETIAEVMGGRKPRLFMNINEVSEVNKPNVHLNEIEGPATGKDFTSKNEKLISK